MSNAAKSSISKPARPPASLIAKSSRARKKGGLHRPARLRRRQTDQWKEAPRSRRHAGAPIAGAGDAGQRPRSRRRHRMAVDLVRTVPVPRKTIRRRRLPGASFSHRAHIGPAEPRNRDRQTFRRRQGPCRVAQAMDCGPPYDVAKIIGFEWSFFVARAVGKGRSCRLIQEEVGGASQFAADKVHKKRNLMRGQRRVVTPEADGGAHGPAHGSSSVVRARFVRDHEVQPATPDRSLRPPGADVAPRSAVERRGRAAAGSSGNHEKARE